jgi:hypothetical protein
MRLFFIWRNIEALYFWRNNDALDFFQKK